MTPLRIIVVGGGHMGRLHIAKVRLLTTEDPGIVLAGIAELDADRRTALESEFDVSVVPDQRKLLDTAEAAIVAVPTIDHHSVVRELLEAGLDILVEKPLAATVEEASELLDLARRKGRVLQVGHLERFNPAMRAITAYAKHPRFVEAHRLGPFPGRATDIDVVRDLMIHDLDIIQQLVGEEPERVEAVGIPVLTNKVDIANARLTFPSGCVANLTASRVSPTPMRKLRFFQNDGYFSIDFLEQSGVIFRRIQNAEGAPTIEMEKLELDAEDALLTQLRAFIDAVRTREGPVVPADDALRALKTALRVVQSMPPIDDLA